MKIRLRHAVQVRPTVILRRRKVPKLETALYMRPLFRDPKFPQGVPINSSLMIRLRCGHIVIRPQHPPKIRKLVYCPMCFMLWTERMEADRLSRSKQRKRIRQQAEQQQEIGDIIMAKKSKKSTSSDDRRGRKVFEFVKAGKDVDDATIMGTVYNAIKRMKSGTVSEICDAAIKGGLKDYTGQDPLNQTGVWLNRMASMGYVRKIKADGAKKKVTIKLKKK